jgi:hypothetical protein
VSRRRSWTVAAAALAGLAACDTGPSGPGTVVGTVTGPPDLGAAVLDVVWKGVQGLEGRGSTQVYSAPVAGQGGRHRFILVGPSGGDLSFAIEVDDVYLEGPIVTLVEATDVSNEPRTVADLHVLLER